MVIREAKIYEDLRKQLGLKISPTLLYRHDQRGQEAYLVSWLKERADPQDPTRLDKPNMALRVYCEKNRLPYLSPTTILWSSKISPGRIGIVGQKSTNGPGSEKLYFILEPNRAGLYLQIMEPYLTELRANMGGV